MVLEIAAARLIAPYLGVSLYTWSSIIGVILAGLALGNWLGGVWADRGAENTEVGVVLVLSGIATLSVLLLLTWVAPAILSMSNNLLSASLLLVGSFFCSCFFNGYCHAIVNDSGIIYGYPNRTYRGQDGSNGGTG